MYKRTAALALLTVFAFFASSCGTKEDNPQAKTDVRYTCDGTPPQCLKIASGWTLEGKISDEIIVDPCAVKLPDGRFRVYANASGSPQARVVVSLISADGVNYTLEQGTRLAADSGHDAFGPNVIILPNGQFRMYLTDQRIYIGETGAPAVISAISDNGLDFVWEPGERLHYSGTGNEAGGINGGNVIRLANGTYRMYYGGHPGTGRAAKALSAVSNDGLTFTREDGVRWDPVNLCPAATNSGVNPKVFIDHNGVYHMFNAGAACDDANHTNEAIGIFEGTSADGLTFSFSRTATVQGYYIKSSYHNNPAADPFVNAEDPTLVLTPAGLRMYFAAGSTGASDVRYYSLLNPSLN